MHVVLGANGGAGSAVVRELASQGYRVRAVVRRGRPRVPEGVQLHRADLTNPAAAKEACAGAAVVYHCVGLPYGDWATQLQQLNDTVVDAAAAAAAKLVVLDNLYMYGPIGGPISESSPRRPASRKGKVRNDLAERLLAAHDTGRLRVTIGRASDFYGPKVNSTPMMTVLQPMAKGGRARWIGRLDLPHTFHYIGDVARGLVTLGRRDEADGAVWHLPAAAPLTGREFITLAANAFGVEHAVSRVSLVGMRLMGLIDEQVRQAAELYYQFDRPFVIDSGRFEAAFESPVTPHDQAIAETVAFLRVNRR